jgi:hypothetical protein
LLNSLKLLEMRRKFIKHPLLRTLLKFSLLLKMDFF